MLQEHFSIFTHRSITVRLDPARYAYVYLIHFSSKLGNPEKKRGQAGHYLGSTAALDHRLERHRAGNGSALMAAVGKAGIQWEISHLWRFESCEQARAFERAMKRRGHNPRLCWHCNPRLRIDDLTFLRQGHSPLLSRPTGKRQPMSNHQPPRFVRRARVVEQKGISTNGNDHQS